MIRDRFNLLTGLQERHACLRLLRCGKGLAVAGLLFTLSACDEVSVDQSTERLCRNQFEACIDQILHANIQGYTCSASGCHAAGGATGGNFKISSGDLAGNFLSAESMALGDVLQRRPLGVGNHVQVFQSEADACMAEIIRWGNTVVPDPDDSSCVVNCPITPGVLAACGM